MPTDNDERVPDSASGRSDDEHVDRNATDEKVIPSKYKKLRRDADGESANDSESSSDDCIDQERMTIDRDAAMKFDCKKFIRRFDQMAEDLRAIMHVQMDHSTNQA
jgi:hypothetical protein